MRRKREPLVEYCRRWARTEALRMAKQQVLDQIKRQGLKASHFTAKEITLRAEARVDADPQAIARAVETLGRR